MKKHFLIVAIVIILATLSGCLSTVHPLFTEKDLVFDPRLIGTWRPGDGNDSVIFERGDVASFNQLPEPIRKLSGKAYVVTYKKEDGDVKYYAFLTKLGKELYLDYYPYENELQQKYDIFYKQHLVKMHSFFRVRFNSDKSFQFGQFDEGYLEKLIKNKQTRIQYEVRYDGVYVITAPTEELQQYVLKYGDVQEAYYTESITTYTKLP